MPNISVISMRQIATRMGKQLSGMLVMAMCLVASFVPSVAVSQIVLGASPFESYVSDNGEPAKLMEIVNSAFQHAQLDVELRVMRAKIPRILCCLRSTCQLICTLSVRKLT